MGKCSRTNKYRPKRAGLETVKDRRKRQMRDAEKMTVDEVRVVKRRGKREREPQEMKAKSWETKLKGLLKLNRQITELRKKEPLDAQQRAKLDRRDDVLLEIDAIVAAHPDAAQKFRIR